MREVRIRPCAQLDIESAFIYLAFELKEPKAACKLVDALHDAPDRLAELPEAGRVFEADEFDRSYRRALVRKCARGQMAAR